MRSLAIRIIFYIWSLNNFGVDAPMVRNFKVAAMRFTTRKSAGRSLSLSVTSLRSSVASLSL